MNPDSPHRTVVVVEDEFFIRAAMVVMLQDAGWDVLEADSGEDAVVFLTGITPIDILVTDIRLAGIMTGWDVADAFRAAWPDLPVMYASANPPLVHRIVKDGFFMEKPWLPGILVSRCERLYESGRAGRDASLH